MNLFLKDHLVCISDALVRLALVIHQRSFDHVTIDATRIVDTFDFVHHHLTIGLTVFTDHPHRDADPDVASKSSGGGHANTRGYNASKQFV